FQYVVAGTRAQLATLGAVLDALHQRKLNIRGQAGKQIASKIMDDLLAAGCGTEVKRSRATIPIPGIDVPFHSSHLLQGADQFRSCINMMVRPSDFDSTQFIGKYIPNLNAVPFDISPEFLQQLYDQTKSPVIERELAQWRPDTTLEEQLELCRYVIIELLSYQFASPVKWIQTQERMFREMGVQRLVEIGPSAILTRMAEGTLMLSGMEKQVALQHIHRDADDIFFASALENAKAEREQESERERQAQQEQLALHEAEVASVASSETAVDLDSAPPSRPSTSGGGGQCEVPDVPLTAVDVIRVVIAQKTKRALGDVPAEKSVKDLTGGKSTLQNEILGDLLKEFSSGGQIPDRPDEITLLELSTGLGAFSGTLGKYTSAQVSRLFSTKMPGGFSLSAVRSLLSSQFGLARAHQQDAVLLQALTMEPAGRFSSTDEAGQWLGTVAQAYAQVHGISLASQQSGSSGAAGAQGVAINSAEFELAQKSQRALAMRQIEAYARYLGIDLREGQRAHESAKDSMGQQQQQLDALVDELGSDFVDGIRGVFDVRKARVFDSHWNWARVDAYEWINAVLAGPAQPAEWSSADAQRLHVLANRADALLLKLASGMVRVLEQTQATAADDPCHAAAHRLACRIRDQCAAAAGGSPVYRELSQPTAPHTAISSAGKISYSEEPRAGEPSFAEYVDHVCAQPTDEARQQQHHLPLVHLREKAPTHDWVYSDDCSAVYYEALREMSAAGTSFGGCTALVTGCSRGSIAAQMLCCLLAGGAKVVATTSSYSRDALLFYEALYKQHGARGSELIVVPFNQGSVSDIRRLVAYIYGPADGAGSGRGLGWNLDYVLPFAAISEYGSDVSRLGSRSELAARIMLTNVLRLLGEIRSTKVELGYGTRQTMAVLPLSPNHGVFGNDGLYGESKAALETAFNRWESEGWGCHMSVAGAVIGWTRGTGLMSVNNTIAQAIESHGTRTFSTFEMAFNLMGLLHPAVAALAQDAPVWADLNGGLQRIARVNDAVNSARLALHSESGRRGAAVLGYGTDLGEALGPAVGQMHQDFVLNPLFNHKQQFPCAPAYEQLEHLRHLEGMVNLDQVVVVTGYGELGPYGHAETRWEMEAHGEFSLEGCVELAWVMGLIRHVNGAVPGVEPRKRQRYAGWVDAASGEPVADHEVKARYEKQILDHTGIRLLEPELLDGQDPAVVPIMRELQIEHDMEPFEASADEAAGFKLRNGDKVDSWANADGSWSVRFLKGAVLMVPKALRFDRLVGAQLPTGWDPARYGIPKDVIEQVDPVTCYALVATVEAFVRSGITDPYELYRYFHVAQVGTSLGSGAGGVFSIRDLYRNRLTDKHVQSDILQETFANTTAAWINMLLLSSSGAIKPPTGGCGTSVLSVDVAADTIRAGKARVMIAGAFEGFVDQGSYEFAQMGATSNAVDELAAGRTPREMSRPTTSTRTGFVEAQGAGVMVLMSASAALEFGAPVYAVLAYSGTATDKQGHSLPAPGMGVLTSARQAPGAKPSRALDMAYRKRQIRRAMRDADAWAAEERELASDEAASPDDLAQHLALIDAKLADMRGEALNTWGQDFWRRLPD
ncbi:fatty acid synthase alpha subunit Lsd1, partial [Coemansia biformis]